MRGIVHSSLQYRFLVIIIAIVLIASGFSQIGAMPVDVLPEFSPPMWRFKRKPLDFLPRKWRELSRFPWNRACWLGFPGSNRFDPNPCPGFLPSISILSLARISTGRGSWWASASLFQRRSCRLCRRSL